MAVKIILREGVEHLGERGEIVSVARGYARNYLYPKGIALEATAGNLKMLSRRMKVWAARVEQETSEADALANKMSAIQLSITKKSGEGGTLYGSVTKPEIVELLAEKGFEVDRKQLGPDRPIKAIGVYPITIRVHRKVTASVQLHVIADSATDEAETSPAEDEGAAESAPESSETDATPGAEGSD